MRRERPERRAPGQVVERLRKGDQRLRAGANSIQSVRESEIGYPSGRFRSGRCGAGRGFPWVCAVDGLAHPRKGERRLALRSAPSEPEGPNRLPKGLREVVPGLAFGVVARCAGAARGRGRQAEREGFGDESRCDVPVDRLRGKAAERGGKSAEPRTPELCFYAGALEAAGA